MLKSAFEAMPFTDPTSDQQIMGPLISERQRERVLDYVRIGQDEGARLVCRRRHSGRCAGRRLLCPADGLRRCS